MRKKLLSLILAAVMVVTLLPVSALADDDTAAPEEAPAASEPLGSEEEQPAAPEEGTEPGSEEEPAEPEAGEEPSENEETGEEAAEPEEPAESEETAEPEEPAEEETAGEETGTTVTFLFDGEPVITVSKDGEEMAADETEDGSVVYTLLPDTYTYLAQAQGYVDGEETVLEVGEEPLTVTVELEAYPYGIAGLPVGYELPETQTEAKALMEENDAMSTLAAAAEGTDYAAGELLFSAESEEEAQLYAAAYGAELTSFEHGFGVMQLPEELSVADAVTASMDSRLVLPAVEPDYIVTLGDPVEDSTSDFMNSVQSTSQAQNWYDWYTAVGEENADPYLSNPTANYETYQWMHDAMNTYSAWGVTTGSSSIRVAVIDTGINTDSGDFGSSTVAATGYYSDYSTYVDGNEHGTHCAGIIAAAMGNGKGGSGVAPGVSLLVYKALSDSGSGSDAAVTSGIYWAADNGADIISMSLGSYYFEYTEYKALKYAISQGCTVVVAMGNDGSNIKCYPAAYNLKGLIAVRSSTPDNQLSAFSNYGSWGDVTAPGSNILSTVPTSVSSSGFTVLSGTSMATPAVAGVCALYASLYGHKQVTPAKMESVIKSSTTNGVLDAYKVVSKGAKAGAVTLKITDGSGVDVTSACKSGGYLADGFVVTAASKNSGEYVIYTTDGTVPTILNGAVKNGKVASNGRISISGLTNEHITLKARAVTSGGVMGAVYTAAFDVHPQSWYTAAAIEGPTTIQCSTAKAATATYKVIRSYNGKTASVAEWKVSQPSYGTASIDKTGKLTVQSSFEGYMTITAVLTNGQTVTQNVYVYGYYSTNSTLTISGADTVLAGKNSKYTLQVNGKTVSAKGYDLWLEDVSGNAVAAGLVTIGTDGTVKANKYTPNGSQVQVSARAKGTTGTAFTYAVTVNQPVTAVNISSVYGTPAYNSKGQLTAFTMFPVDASVQMSSQTYSTFRVSTSGNTSAPYTVTVSKKNALVVEDQGSGQFKLVSEPGFSGTVKVTVKAADGSGKSASFNVKVVVPASNIYVKPSAKPSALTEDYVLAAGKSASNSVVLGSDYGKPTSTKVAWHYQVFKKGVGSDTSSVDITSYVSSYVTLSASGKLSINKNFYYSGFGSSSYRFACEIWATTEDGSDLTSEHVTYYLCPAAGRLWITYGGYNITGRTFYLSTYDYCDFKYVFNTSVNAYSGGVTVTSSNPNVAGVYLAANGINDWNYIEVITGSKKGTAKITVKANDGSGKSASFTVRVY